MSHTWPHHTDPTSWYVGHWCKHNSMVWTAKQPARENLSKHCMCLWERFGSYPIRSYQIGCWSHEPQILLATIMVKFITALTHRWHNFSYPPAIKVTCQHSSLWHCKSWHKQCFKRRHIHAGMSLTWFHDMISVNAMFCNGYPQTQTSACYVLADHLIQHPKHMGIVYNHEPGSPSWHEIRTLFCLW